MGIPTFSLKLHADDGGGTEIDLSDYVENYRPASAPDSESSVTEALTVRLLGGSSLSTPRNTSRDISNFFNQARRLQEQRIYPRVWIYFKWDTSDTEYRSPLYGGNITTSGRALTPGLVGNYATEWDIVWTRGNYWETTSESTATASTDAADSFYRAHTTDDYVYNCQQITDVTNETLATGDGATKTFSGTLAHYPVWYQGWKDWYDDDTLNITLGYNVGGGATTLNYPSTNADVTTFTINRRTGAYSLVFATAPLNATVIKLDYSYGYGNAVEFEADKFCDSFTDNDMSTPLKLEIKNLSASNDLQIAWMGFAAAQQDAFPVGNLRADDATATGGTQQADAACTLGYRRDFTVTTSEAKAWTSQQVNFSSTQDGRYYIPIMRFSPTANTSNIPNIFVRWKLIVDDLTNTVVYESEQYRPSSASKIIEPIGFIKVSPWPNISRLVDINYRLELWMQSVSGSVTVSLDFIQLFPTDWFCRAAIINDTLDENDTLIIDTALQDAYIDLATGSVDHYGNVEILHGWPEILPGWADGGWLYILYHDSTAYTAPITWPLEIKVKYRPRRRSL